MEPQRDLDGFGKMLMEGSLELVMMDFATRAEQKTKTMDFEEARKALADDLYALRWGPTEVPIFNLLGLFTLIVPQRRPFYIEIADFYIKSGVPVDGRDLSGTSALSHCFSTKPALDLSYAQMLYDAGGDVNSRNRYGTIVAHEIVQVYNPSDPDVVRKSTQALEWFLSHGGSMDIADTDGMTPRYLVQRLSARIPALKRLVETEDKRRSLKSSSACACCGREEEKILTCSKCKRVKYCNPNKRGCQKLDWPKHKTECKAV